MKKSIFYLAIVIGSLAVTNTAYNSEKDRTLIDACIDGNIEAVKALTKNGINIDIDSQGDLALSLVSSHPYSNLEVVEILIAANTNKDPQDVYGRSLYIAIYHDNFEIANTLIAAGADVNYQKEHSYKSLLIGIVSRYQVTPERLEMFKSLIAIGVDVDLEERSGWTALMWASKLGHLEAVRSLIAAGANVDHQAFNKDIAAWILEGLNLADRHYQNTRLTALMLASKNGHLEIAEALIEAGADVNKQTLDGSTALLFARRQGHLRIAEALRIAGARR